MTLQAQINTASGEYQALLRLTAELERVSAELEAAVERWRRWQKSRRVSSVRVDARVSADGQRWSAWEVDLARGARQHRIGGRQHFIGCHLPSQMAQLCDRPGVLRAPHCQHPFPILGGDARRRASAARRSWSSS